MTSRPAAFASAMLGLCALLACDQMKATTDRAMITLSLKPVCPDAVDGRAVGADSPEGALGCFRHAVQAESVSLMLRVTCTSRNPASCKQTDATQKEAEKALVDLKKLSFTSVLGRWDDNDKTAVFAVDTKPGDKRVGTVVTCKIAEGDKWAVCELGEVGRDFAEQKLKKGSLFDRLALPGSPSLFFGNAWTLFVRSYARGTTRAGESRRKTRENWLKTLSVVCGMRFGRG